MRTLVNRAGLAWGYLCGMNQGFPLDFLVGVLVLGFMWSCVVAGGGR